MWKRQRDDDDDQSRLLTEEDDLDSKKIKINNDDTILSTTTTNTNTIILIDNDIRVKSNIFNLLKSKFQHQQLGKKLWLKNRELKHYDFIPIEFSKDAYFVSNFIKRMNQNKQQFLYFHHDWYGKDYFQVLSDELKMEIDTVSNAEIEHSFDYRFGKPDTTLIDRMNRICSQSETKCIEIICQIAKVVFNIDTFISKYKSVFPFIDKLLNDKEFLLKCISSSYKVFKFVQFKVDEQKIGPYDLQFILKCLNINSKVLRYINKSSSIFNDKQLIMKLFQSITMKRRGKFGREIFEKLSQPLKNDREVVLLAVEKGFPVLNIVSSNELVSDREIVLQSVRNNGSGLLYVIDDDLKNDREIVLEAVRNDSNVVYYVSSTTLNDREFVFELVSKLKAPLFCPSSVLKQRDRELILVSIKNHPVTLKNVSAKLLSNREFVLECVKINGLCLRYVPPNFQSDVEIVNEAIKQNPFSIGTIDISNIDCKNSLLNAVELMHIKYSEEATDHVNDLECINDLDVALKLIETYPLSIHFLNENFRERYQELTYKATLIHNGYWMKFSEDAYQERINHAYYSAKIDSNSNGGGGGDQEINYYRNVNKTNLLWKDLKWREW